MKNVWKIVGMGVAVSLLGLETAARAQDAIPDPQPNTQIGAGSPPSELPAPRSDNDAQPKVAAPMADAPGVTAQAGVGGTQAYGRVGVLELGGSGGLTIANKFNRFELSPSVGLFIADNLELSLISSFSRSSIDIAGGKSVTATEFKLLLEPSYHLPFSETLFGFFGLGAGVSYLSGQDTGFALQPRIGLNILIGRSGILTPSLNVAYSTVDAINTPSGTVVGVQTSYGMNVGYTVMW